MIAGTSSGVGKTTVTLAIIAAMRRRRIAVQPFKGGPDFLDTGHLTRIAGRSARNLDTWMLSAEANVSVLQDASCGAGAVVVEGMMGLFDGKNGATEAGSSAEIAKLLKLPVVLVIDAGKSARSVAAVVLGFELFDPQLFLAGIILNRVANERHYHMLETAIRVSCKTSVFGWLPRDAAISIPERHLGLHTAEEANGSSEAIASMVDRLAVLAEEHLDLNVILSLQCGLSFRPRIASTQVTRKHTVRVGVARDHAFSFYYEDNLDLLREQGAELVSFSPVYDDQLPPDLDALYLGGGYPELHAEQLSRNRTMLASMHAFAQTGRPVYAECGGMIYLSESLTLLDGNSYKMTGVFPLAVKMTARLVQFGYVSVTLMRDTILGPRGTVIRGHSFHHSRVTNTPELTTSYQVQYSLSGEEEPEGYSIGNVLASYMHLHFRAERSIARHFIEAALTARAQHMVTA
jgi:cobyrinic acid a,c-diamide synthase